MAKFTEKEKALLKEMIEEALMYLDSEADAEHVETLTSIVKKAEIQIEGVE